MRPPQPLRTAMLRLAMIDMVIAILFAVLPASSPIASDASLWVATPPTSRKRGLAVATELASRGVRMERLFVAGWGKSLSRRAAGPMRISRQRPRPGRAGRRASSDARSGESPAAWPRRRSPLRSGTPPATEEACSSTPRWARGSRCRRRAPEYHGAEYHGAEYHGAECLPQEIRGSHVHRRRRRHSHKDWKRHICARRLLAPCAHSRPTSVSAPFTRLADSRLIRSTIGSPHTSSRQSVRRARSTDHPDILAA